MGAKQLPHNVERFISEHSLTEKPGPLVVGVSGGVDSVCLLHVLVTLAKKLHLDLHIAHLNHQLRGDESNADAEYVRRLARDLNIASTIDKRDVQEYQSTHQCSLEEAAREVRYSFFSEVAESLGGQTVAVAHTANDQAETILMHVIRGTGLSGLRGMRPVSRWNLPDGKSLTIIRPLLDASREDTETYCDIHKLWPRYDSSNRSMEYLRNRIRAEIMPKLLDYNPNIVDSLSRMAHIVADDIAYLDTEVSRVYQSAVEEFPQGVSLDNKAVSEFPPALGRQLLRKALGRLLGSTRDIELVHIESVLDTLKHPAGKKLSLPYGLTFYGDYEKSIITQGEDPLAFLPPLNSEYPLNTPGKTMISGWQVTTEVIEGKCEVQASDQLTAFLDIDYTGSNLIVRSRKGGDRFQPLGMKDTKKLQDFMVDSKIPRAWRDRVPLVCAGDQIVWVVGWRIDHKARVTKTTQKILRLEFELE